MGAAADLAEGEAGMITENECQGMKRINWNGGIIREYYRPITGDGIGFTDSRLSIRFGERNDTPFAVYLILPQSIIKMNGTKTLADFDNLFSLIGQTE